MSDYVDGKVLCPFYCKIKKINQSICCEGIYKSTNINLTFNSEKARDNYLNKFCCKDYKKCNIAEMQYMRYKKEGE